MTAEGPSDAGATPAPAQGLSRLKRFTPARIALGRAGSAQPTQASLRFALDHARARDAVHAALDLPGLETTLRGKGWDVFDAHSAARERAEYLHRPDLGRRLSQESRRAVEQRRRGCDIAIVAADGLSALAVNSGLVPLLDHLGPQLRAQGIRVGPLIFVNQGRVAVGDEIGELLGAKLVVVLIGERPGLSAADSLGAYVTWRRRLGPWIPLEIASPTSGRAGCRSRRRRLR